MNLKQKLLPVLAGALALNTSCFETEIPSYPKRLTILESEREPEIKEHPKIEIIGKFPEADKRKEVRDFYKSLYDYCDEQTLEERINEIVSRGDLVVPISIEYLKEEKSSGQQKAAALALTRLGIPRISKHLDDIMECYKDRLSIFPGARESIRDLLTMLFVHDKDTCVAALKSSGIRKEVGFEVIDRWIKDDPSLKRLVIERIYDNLSLFSDSKNPTKAIDKIKGYGEVAISVSIPKLRSYSEKEKTASLVLRGFGESIDPHYKEISDVYAKLSTYPSEQKYKVEDLLEKILDRNKDACLDLAQSPFREVRKLAFKKLTRWSQDDDVRKFLESITPKHVENLNSQDLEQKIESTEALYLIDHLEIEQHFRDILRAYNAKPENSLDKSKLRESLFRVFERNKELCMSLLKGEYEEAQLTTFELLKSRIFDGFMNRLDREIIEFLAEDIFKRTAWGFGGPRTDPGEYEAKGVSYHGGEVVPLCVKYLKKGNLSQRKTAAVALQRIRDREEVPWDDYYNDIETAYLRERDWYVALQISKIIPRIFYNSKKACLSGIKSRSGIISEEAWSMISHWRHNEDVKKVLSELKENKRAQNHLLEIRASDLVGSASIKEILDRIEKQLEDPNESLEYKAMLVGRRYWFDDMHPSIEEYDRFLSIVSDTLERHKGNKKIEETAKSTIDHIEHNFVREYGQAILDGAVYFEDPEYRAGTWYLIGKHFYKGGETKRGKKYFDRALQECDKIKPQVYKYLEKRELVENRESDNTERAEASAKFGTYREIVGRIEKQLGDPNESLEYKSNLLDKVGGIYYEDISLEDYDRIYVAASSLLDLCKGNRGAEEKAETSLKGIEGSLLRRYEREPLLVRSSYSDTFPLGRSEIWIGLGEYFFERDNIAAAQRYFNKGLETYPKNKFLVERYLERKGIQIQDVLSN